MPSGAPISDPEEAADEYFGPPIPGNSAKSTAPTESLAELPGHAKAVTAVALESLGSRMVTGSTDQWIRIWDFAGMDDTNRKAFRELQPEEGYPVKSLEYGTRSDRFLCVTGNACPKIFDRDGFELAKFAGGDMYLQDLRNTKGHVAGCSGGIWSPIKEEICFTCGLDGTIRVWNVENTLRCSATWICKPERGTGRIQVSAIGASLDGRSVVAGASDGFLHIWDARKSGKTTSSVRPERIIKQAHFPGSEFSSIKFSKANNYCLYSLALDGVIKLWDLRATSKSPAAESREIPLSPIASTNIEFSPDSDLLLIGSSALPKSTDSLASIEFLDPLTLEWQFRHDLVSTSKPEKSSDKGNLAVLQTHWHPVLNQIFLGCSDGITRILFDEKSSRKGALSFIHKQAKKRDISDMQKHMHIITPHSLPLFRESSNRSKQRERDLQDPIKAKIPEKPFSGPGQGGKLGSGLNSFLVSKKMNLQPVDRSKDPRESLWKYAEVSERDPYFSKAYRVTQPVPIFDNRPESPESPDQKKRKRSSGSDILDRSRTT